MFVKYFFIFSQVRKKKGGIYKWLASNHHKSILISVGTLKLDSGQIFFSLIPISIPFSIEF